MNYYSIDFWEDLFRSQIGRDEMSLRWILTGLHNAMVHGGILIDNGVHVKDEDLQKWFDDMDNLLLSTKQVISNAL